MHGRFLTQRAQRQKEGFVLSVEILLLFFDGSAGGFAPPENG
jgi:hypothetical protein